MEDKKITVKELQLAVEQEVTQMVQEVVEAMNNAKPGSIIADSEEPVRDANVKFKQQIFQKALTEYLCRARPSFNLEASRRISLPSF